MFFIVPKKKSGEKLSEKLTFACPNIAKAAPKDMKEAEKFNQAFPAVKPGDNHVLLWAGINQ